MFISCCQAVAPKNGYSFASVFTSLLVGGSQLTHEINLLWLIPLVLTVQLWNRPHRKYFEQLLKQDCCLVTAHMFVDAATAQQHMTCYTPISAWFSIDAKCKSLQTSWVIYGSSSKGSVKRQHVTMLCSFFDMQIVCYLLLYHEIVYC